MKEWKIPVSWEMCGTVTVEANTLEEAMAKAKHDRNIQLPKESFYVDGSFDLSFNEEDTVRKYYNKNQKDEGDE